MSPYGGAFVGAHHDAEQSSGRGRVLGKAYTDLLDPTQRAEPASYFLKSNRVESGAPGLPTLFSFLLPSVTPFCYQSVSVTIRESHCGHWDALLQKHAVWILPKTPLPTLILSEKTIDHVQPLYTTVLLSEIHNPCKLGMLNINSTLKVSLLPFNYFIAI